MRTGKSKSLVLASVAVASFTSEMSRASVWKGAADLWSNPAAWDTGNVPGRNSETDATINSGTPSVDQAFTLRNLNLNGGALTGTTAGLLTVGTQWRFLGGSVNAGANLILNGASQLGADNSTLGNAGSITFSTVSPISNASMVLNNSGTIALGANVTLQLLNGSTTSGRYTGAAGSTLMLGYGGNSADVPTHTLAASARIATAGAFQVSATNLYVQPGATVSAASVTIDQFTNVSGGGTFLTPTHLASASLLPGRDFGDIDTLQFSSSATLDTSPVYTADLKSVGGSPTSDLINASGPVSIAGLILNANVSDGSGAFTLGERFVIVHSDTALVGDRGTLIDAASSFDENNLIPAYDSGNNLYEFQVQITSNELALIYVPEPTLVLPAAAGLLALRRRRLP